MTPRATSTSRLKLRTYPSPRFIRQQNLLRGMIRVGYRAKEPDFAATKRVHMFSHSHDSFGDDERLLQLFSVSVVDYALIELDRLGNVRAWNAGAQRVQGYESEQICGRPYSVFFTQDDRDSGLPMDLLNTASENDCARHSGWRVAKDNIPFWADTVITALVDSHGATDGFVEIVRDLTERQANDFNRLFVESSPDATIVANEKGRILFANPQIESLLGYDRSELMEMNVEDLIPSRGRSAQSERDEESNAQSTGAALELVAMRRGGVDVAVDVRSSQFESHGRQVTFIALRDATERRRVADVRADYTADQEQLNRELKELSAFNELLIEFAPDATIAVDADGLIVSANPQTEVLFGYSRDELLTMSIYDLVPAARERYPTLRQDHLPRPVVRPDAGMELYARSKDQSEVPVDILLRPFQSKASALVLAVIRNATDRHRVEIARAEADRANRAKSEFLSRMSHELRTPLAAVLGFTAVLDEEHEQLTEKHHKMVQRVDRAGTHLMSLINDVLDISRVEAGQLSLSVEPVNVGNMVRGALELTEPLFVEQQLTLSARVDPTLHVSADRSRLQQVLVNLLSNAAKYNLPGGTVTVSAAHDDAAFVLILVADTGNGIDPDSAGNLFTPFSRLGAERTKVQGTGLGLALSKGLVEQMDGTLEMISTGPDGSSFGLRLPSTDTKDRGAEQTQDARRDGLLLALAEQSAEVVYVEDNPDNVQLLIEAISSCRNVRTRGAKDGTTGLELIRQSRPDIVFLDLHLPDLDGRQVLSALRADVGTRDIPVVILTADAIGSSEQEMIDLGATAYLTKPFQSTEILGILAKILLLHN